MQQQVEKSNQSGRVGPSATAQQSLLREDNLELKTLSAAPLSPQYQRIADENPQASNGPISQEVTDTQENNDPVASSGNALPFQLKRNMESLSGVNMDGVTVHYNSSQPAQFKAHAFARGNDIHISSGQEQHLAHEAWHVVQQRQGRVQSTTQLAGQGVNDTPSLETEADEMGDKAMQTPFQLKTQKAITSSFFNQSHFSPPSQVTQLRGERTAVVNAFLARGSMGGRVSRGNRRDSLIRTGYESRARLKAFRDYKNTINPIRAYAQTAATTAGIANPATFVTDNFTRIMGYAATRAEVGNCGEFAGIVAGDLLASTTNQWVHKCCMWPQSDFDHAFVITYPAQIPAGSTLPGSVDQTKAMIADAWDGHKVMNVQQFLDGGNAYGRAGLTHRNIHIDSSEQATGIDTIAAIKGDLDTYGTDFNTWFTTELLDPTSVYAQVAAVHNTRGTFGTRGSDVVGGIQDTRPMSALYTHNTPPHDDEELNARSWWTDPTATTDVSAIAAANWSIFSGYIRATTEIQNTVSAVKLQQFITGVLAYQRARLPDLDNVADQATLHTAIDNLAGNAEKVAVLSDLSPLKRKAYLDLQPAATTHTLLMLMTVALRHAYLSTLADGALTAQLQALAAPDRHTYLNTLTIDNKIIALTPLTLGEVDSYIRTCWDKSFSGFFALSSPFPYKADILNRLPPQRVLDIINRYSASERETLRKQLSKDMQSAVELETQRRVMTTIHATHA